MEGEREERMKETKRERENANTIFSNTYDDYALSMMIILFWCSFYESFNK